MNILKETFKNTKGGVFGVVFAVHMVGEAEGMDIVLAAPRNPDGAIGDAVHTAACIACGGKGIVGVEEGARSSHHLLYYGAAHYIMSEDVFVLHLEKLLFQVVLIAHYASLKIIGSTTNLGERGCYPATGAGLGGGNCLVAFNHKAKYFGGYLLFGHDKYLFVQS